MLSCTARSCALTPSMPVKFLSLHLTIDGDSCCARFLFERKVVWSTSSGRCRASLERSSSVSGLRGAVLPVVYHGVVVIHRHPLVARDGGGCRRAVRAGTELMERHDEVVSADVQSSPQRADASVAIAIVRHVNLQCRCTASHEGARLETAAWSLVSARCRIGHVRGVDAALEALQPVGLLDDLEDVADASRAPASSRNRAAAVAAPAGPCRPR